MGNLSKFQPEKSKTVDAIFAKRKELGDQQEPREHLGASILGDNCRRRLWYSFRWCTDSVFPGRIHRVFDRGNLEEPRAVSDLRSIGCEVHEVDPDTGEQFRVSFAGGHGGGSLDGCILGVPEAPKTWHVLEIKTMSEKYFRKLERFGVKETYPKHYAQMVIYMHLTGMTRAIYFGCNKNDDDLHTERIKEDKQLAEKLIKKGEVIIRSTVPLSKVSDDANSMDCKFCGHKELCHGNQAGVAVPCKVNCRTCFHSDADPSNGKWTCGMNDKVLSKNDQMAGCIKHVFAPEIVSFADMVDVGENKDGSMFVLYRNGEQTWKNGNSTEHQFSSKELTRIPMNAMLDLESLNSVQRFKEAFCGEVK